jgi:Tfp pilus assembly protein PilO
MKSRGPIIDLIKAHRLFWGVCGALFLVNVLFYFLFVTSEFRKIGQLQSRVQAERKKVSEQRKQQADIARYRSMVQAWQSFEQRLPGKIEFPERVQQLKQILSRNRLRSEELSFQSEPDKDLNLVRFTTTFRSTGQYLDFKQFLAELQAMPGLFVIHQLGFRQAGSEKPLEMDIELAAYFRGDRKPLEQ